MNFFEFQDQARSKTRLLICYFVLAIIGIISSVYIAFLAIFFFANSEQSSFNHLQQFSWWQPELFLAVAGATLILVLGSSFGKILTLRSGGQGIATSLGGQLLTRSGASVEETQLLNIVEEMAIASGMPVPAVYLLPEAGINAFAAGYSINDAVIGVTQGAVDQLNRDEMQGVVAHEFSHILNGDMRLNIHLIGLIFGILVLSILGRMLLRSDSRRVGRRKGKEGAGVALFGVALLLIGVIGSFFARVIKSAISRQREFLADAAAVQFTRNPLGIGGALKKILASSDQAKIHNEHATEVSHMFFADSLSNFWSGMLATHPPLEQRIQRLGIRPNDEESKSRFSKPTQTSASDRIATSNLAQRQDLVTPSADKIAEIGKLLKGNLIYAQQLIGSLPADFRLKLSDPNYVQAVVIALLNRNTNSYIELPDLVLGKLAEAKQLVARLDGHLRLLILDLGLPALKKLSLGEYEAFRRAVFLVLETNQIQDAATSFDYALAATATHNLDVFFGIRSAKVHDNMPLETAKEPLEILFHIILRYAEDTSKDRSDVLQRINLQLGLNLSLAEKVTIQMSELNGALKQLQRLQPNAKKQLLEVCIESVFHDGRVKVEEAEIVRAIAETLGCPIPPIVAEAGGRL